MTSAGSLTGQVCAVARRGFDITTAAVGLIMALPLVAAIAVAIRLDTPGPVFFAQTRIGRNGVYFRLFKFRKFRHHLDNAGHAVTLKHDPRMTRVGRWLERSKLDELPQMWNILRGDMAVVGPRPETLDFEDCFVGRYTEVLAHRPGLFGPNQVMFRHESTLFPPDQDPHAFYREVLFPAKAENDLSYFRTRSLMMDIVWLARGVAATLGMLSVPTSLAPQSPPSTGPITDASAARSRITAELT